MIVRGFGDVRAIYAAGVCAGVHRRLYYRRSGCLCGGPETSELATQRDLCGGVETFVLSTQRVVVRGYRDILY